MPEKLDRGGCLQGKQSRDGSVVREEETQSWKCLGARCGGGCKVSVHAGEEHSVSIEEGTIARTQPSPEWKVESRAD